jgi:hypothetical protein
LPVKVNEPHHQDETGNPCQPLARAAHIAEQQDKEWNDKLAKHQGRSHILPTAIGSGDEKWNLFLQVGRPNQQVLGKRNVSPEDHKAQNKAAQIPHQLLVSARRKILDATS